MLRGCLTLIALAFVGILVVVAFSSAAGPKPPANASQTGSTANDPDEFARQTVLNYTACQGGMTVSQGAGLLTSLVRAQKVNGSYAHFKGHDGPDEIEVVGIQYVAANGSDKDAQFTFNKTTWAVNAGNDDGLAILNAMRAGCRK